MTGETPHDETPRSSRVRWEVLAPLGLAVLTFATYSQVGRHEFVNFDDGGYLFNNAYIQGPLNIDAVRWALTSTYAGNWHPLTWLSYMVEYQLFGLKAAGYHLTNVLLHTASAVLLFGALRSLTGALWRSAFVAALFALHPLHVESVAWAAERKDVLSGLFWMATLWAYGAYAARPGSLWRYLCVAVCLALGLAAKSMLVTLPFVLLLLDLWPLRRLELGAGGVWIDGAQLRRLVLEKRPLFGLVAVCSWVALLAQRGSGAVVEGLPLGVRVANALVAYTAYIAKMIWPAKLAVFYPHPGAAVSVPLAAASAALLLSVSFLVARQISRRPYLLVGWLWYLGTLVPVIGLVQIGHQAMADRYAYLPLTGLFVMVAWGVPDLCQRWRVSRAWLAPAALAVVAALTVTTWHQLGHWRSSTTLFEHAVRVTERNAFAHATLGISRMNAGDDEGAVRHLRQALSIDPTLFTAHQNLAAIFARQGDLQTAHEHRAAALWIVLEAAETGTLVELLSCNGTGMDRASGEEEGRPGESSRSPYRLGTDLACQGKVDEALPHLESAVQLEPTSEEARLALGSALLIQGRQGSAIEQYEEVLRRRPNDPGAHYRLGFARLQQRRYEEAQRHLSEVLRQRPDHLGAHRLMRGIRSNGFTQTAAWLPRGGSDG